MKNIFVRPVRQTDTDEYIRWAFKTPFFDQEVPKYPSTYTLVAFGRGERFAYCPVQQPQFVESLAMNPTLEPLTAAFAMKELIQTIVSQAYIKGSREVYFLGTDPKTTEIAVKHGFEEVPHKLYRLKLHDLEGKDEPKI